MHLWHLRRIPPYLPQGWIAPQGLVAWLKWLWPWFMSATPLAAKLSPSHFLPSLSQLLLHSLNWRMDQNMDDLAPRWPAGKSLGVSIGKSHPACLLYPSKPSPCLLHPNKPSPCLLSPWQTEASLATKWTGKTFKHLKTLLKCWAQIWIQLISQP